MSALPAGNHRANHDAIPTAPLMMVVTALVLAVLPLLDKVAPFSLAIFFLALVVRVMSRQMQFRLPGLAVKLLIMSVGLGGVWLSYGSLLGIEPGLGVLLILVSLKLLESATARDFQVLALLGWFLCLCGLFFTQTLALWMYLGSLCLFFTGALIHFHREGGRKEWRASLRAAFTIFMQSAPLVLLLFLFFPRIYGGFRLTLGRSMTGAAGMSDRLEPGVFSGLVANSERAFRAEFPDGNIPPISQLYWRGGVLWRGEGMTWLRGGGGLGYDPRPLLPEGETGVRQRIILEPHGAQWLFALDRPVRANIRNVMMEPGGYLKSYRQIISPFRYEVVSRLSDGDTRLRPNHREAALQLPSQEMPEVRALAKSWRVTATTDREVVEAGLRWFRKGKFSYTLSPGAYTGPDAMREFLFQRQSGFCEHYAAAFATLMRYAEIPARVVIGYHGGQYVKLGNYVVVRQNDAHAWCEVWLEGVGWHRVDPTEVIAPDRISGGLTSYLDAQELGDMTGEGAFSNTALGMRELLRELRFAWDNLNYQWDLRVLNYDEETQRTFFAVVGLGKASWTKILVWTGVGIFAILVLHGLFLQKHQGLWLTRDPVMRHFGRVCERLAAAGVKREPWEGPLQFGARAAELLPENREQIQRVTELYARYRYAQERPPVAEFVSASRALRRSIKRRRRTKEVTENPGG